MRGVLLLVLLVLLRAGEAQRRVSMEDLDQAIHLVQEELNVIYNRYEMFKPIGEAFFLMQHNMSPRDFDLLKVQFATKILTSGANYTMIFGGSSVTAGHDNGPGQAYPHVIEKRMEEMLKTVDINLKVRNIAQGANGCVPSDWCYSSMGGYNADVIGWEQTFNCGSDIDILELMHRTAFWSKTPQQVGSIYMAASGSGSTAGCNVTDFGKPYSDEDWKPSDDNLPNWYPNEVSIQQWKKKLDEVMRLNGLTFTEAIIAPYRDVGVAINSFRFSQKYQLWWCRTIYGDNHSKATPHYIFHSTARPDRWTCEPEKIYAKCAIKFLRKESSEYGKPKRKRNHHPPKAHHMMRAEFFVFHYGMAFLAALYSVKDTFINEAQNTDILQRKSLKAYAEELKSLSPNITMPLFLPSEPNIYFTTYRPECYTDFRPHFNKEMTLAGQIVGSHAWTVGSLDLRPVPDENFYEARPSLIAENGTHRGEIFLAVNVLDMTKHVVLCSYMTILDPAAVLLSVELHVSSSRLDHDYVPMKTSPTNRHLQDEVIKNHHKKEDVKLHQHRHKMHRDKFPSMHSDYYSYNHTYHEDGRIIWSNVTASNACLVMNDVPPGNHVIGILPRRPKWFSITHMIVVK